MKPQTAEWIEKAEGDWRVAQRELGSEDPVYDAVCFHAQQCAEKYLKALMEEQGLSAPKTHDLVVLLNSLVDRPLGMDRERAALARLSTYAVAFRYPGEEAVAEDAEESLKTALRIRAWAREKLGLSNAR